MRNPQHRRLLVRYGLDLLGFVLVIGGSYIVRDVIRPETVLARSFAHIGTLIAGLLFWIAAAGLKRDKQWGVFCGYAACAFLLPGFPWLTLAGALGILVLATLPAAVLPGDEPPPPSRDYWEKKKRSKAQPVFAVIVWLFAMGAQGWLAVLATRWGMPRWYSGVRWWAYFSTFVFLNAALHEGGHAVVAWAAGFKIHIVSVGPFVIWRDHGRYRIRFNIARLFETGGYIGAAPTSEDHLRGYEIAILIAGPAMNALTCLASIALFVALPGTPYQSWWGPLSVLATVAGVMTVVNLTPLGYCDGSMLYHLILNTKRGRLLLQRKRVIRLEQEAEQAKAEANFQRELELKREMLERSLAFGADNAFAIAASYQALGSAYSRIEDWPLSFDNYSKALAYEGEMAAVPGVAANAWSGLHLAATRRGMLAAAGRAYAHAIRILEKQKRNGGHRTGNDLTWAMIAQAHARNQAHDNAISAAEAGIKCAPADSSLRPFLLGLQAVCRIQAGDTRAGTALAEAAADRYRSVKNDVTRRNLDWEDLADLGANLWRAGDAPTAERFLREGIHQLEACGARQVAAQHRITLAALLRETGRHGEGFAELPAEADLTATSLRAYLAERVALHLANGRPDRAAKEAHELLALWRAHECAPEVEIACAGALLGRALLADEDLLGAEAVALQAADVLGPMKHPDAATCLVTIALARSRGNGEKTDDMLVAAFREIDEAILLCPAEKERKRTELGEQQSESMAPGWIP